MNSRMILLAIEERLLRARYGLICSDDAVRQIGQLLDCDPNVTERRLTFGANTYRNQPANHTADVHGSGFVTGPGGGYTKNHTAGGTGGSSPFTKAETISVYEAAQAAIEDYDRREAAGEDVSHEIRPRMPGGSDF